MITICSTSLTKIKHYEEIFLESIVRHTKHVSEVILGMNDQPPSFHEEWVERGITFHRYGSQEGMGACVGDEHALGLHCGIEWAKNDWVYCCDPDIFFMSAVDDFYLELIEKYGLDTIGCSHHSATELGQTFFPWHGNVLLHKSKLPPADFLAEEKRVPGKFLLAGMGVSKQSEYPNPNGNFDTSSGLWYWSHLSNWKWLSFQTTNVHLYTTSFYRTSKNIKITARMPKQSLIYHAVSGSIELAKWEPYKAAYEKYKEPQTAMLKSMKMGENP